MDADQQAKLVSALQDARRFPHATERFEVIETHISRVLLTGSHAYKFKKPVNLGFLDFSTLEKRRFYCYEELRLNRRLAPELYEAVVPVTGSIDDPGLNGAGEPIDYAVRMRQFPDHARMDQVSDRGELTADHIDQLSAALATFHRGAPVATCESLYGTSAAIGDRVLQNFDQIKAHCDNNEVREKLKPLREWSVQALANLREDFELRRREGWIRECHGDLHLANMALIDGRVVMFDCLEFSDDLRWIDPLCEVAFVSMDLEHRGHLALSRRFLNNYLESANDYQSLTLLRFYKIYRAMVRAKVAAIESRQQHKDRARFDATLRNLNSYLDQATGYCAPTAPAPLILMHGFSGSGKSWLSRRLVEKLGAVRLRSDVERKRLLGLEAEQCTDSGIAVGAYAPDITRNTYRRLQALAYPILDAGLPVIVDATCLTHAQRAPFQRLAQVAGTPFVILDLQAPDALLRERITQRRTRERDASEATLAVLTHQQSIDEPLTLDERRHSIDCDVSTHVDADALSEAILARA